MSYQKPQAATGRECLLVEEGTYKSCNDETRTRSSSGYLKYAVVLLMGIFSLAVLKEYNTRTPAEGRFGATNTDLLQVETSEMSEFTMLRHFGKEVKFDVFKFKSTGVQKLCLEPDRTPVYKKIFLGYKYLVTGSYPAQVSKCTNNKREQKLMLDNKGFGIWFVDEKEKPYCLHPADLNTWTKNIGTQQGMVFLNDMDKCKAFAGQYRNDPKVYSPDRLGWRYKDAFKIKYEKNFQVSLIKERKGDSPEPDDVSIDFFVKMYTTLGNKSPDTLTPMSLCHGVHGDSENGKFLVFMVPTQAFQKDKMADYLWEVKQLKKSQN